MTLIRQEITGATGGGIHNSTIVGVAVLDTTVYDTPTTYNFVISTTVISTTVTLRRVGTTTDDASITTDSSGAQKTYTTTFSPPAGQTEYFAFQAIGSGGGAWKIVVTHSGTTKTQTHLPVTCGTATQSVTSTTGINDFPRYWKYDASKWDGTTAFWFEAVIATDTTKVTGTATLQVADGTGDGFAGWADVTNGVVSTTTVTNEGKRVRAASAFTPVDGRNYRTIYKTSTSKTPIYVYMAAVIVVQTNSPTKLQPTIFIQGAGGTLAGACCHRWDSSQWADVTNTYDLVVDAADGATGSATLYETDGGGDIASVSAPDNQGTTTSITLPASQDVSMRSTGGTYYGGKIQVNCTISTTPPPVAATGGSTLLSMGVG